MSARAWCRKMAGCTSYCGTLSQGIELSFSFVWQRSARSSMQMATLSRLWGSLMTTRRSDSQPMGLMPNGKNAESACFGTRKPRETRARTLKRSLYVAATLALVPCATQASPLGFFCETAFRILADRINEQFTVYHTEEQAVSGGMAWRHTSYMRRVEDGRIFWLDCVLPEGERVLDLWATDESNGQMFGLQFKLKDQVLDKVRRR